ncbi:BapA prefix-like domain-containing protein, partial [Acinetobacter baumannii]|nr:BapA prefix-like domain-containing protein [Acinetobacter baumannii]
MSHIKVVSKETHKVLNEIDANKVVLSQASVVIVKVHNKDDVLKIERDGNNAVITLVSGETIVITDFFVDNKNSLVLEDDNHKLIWAQFTDANGQALAEVSYQPIQDIEPLLYDHEGISPWAWLAIPAAIGTVAAISNSDTGNKDQKDTTPPSAPSEVIATANPDGSATVTG